MNFAVPSVVNNTLMLSNMKYVLFMNSPWAMSVDSLYLGYNVQLSSKNLLYVLSVILNSPGVLSLIVVP